MTHLTEGQAKALAEAQARFQLPEFTDEQLIQELVKRGWHLDSWHLDGHRVWAIAEPS